MSGIIGKKLGMTSLFDSNGKSVGCTVIEAGPCFVTQIKDREKDGYRAIQLSYDDHKPSKVNKSTQGHFAKSNISGSLRGKPAFMDKSVSGRFSVSL